MQLCVSLTVAEFTVQNVQNPGKRSCQHRLLNFSVQISNSLHLISHAIRSAKVLHKDSVTVVCNINTLEVSKYVSIAVVVIPRSNSMHILLAVASILRCFPPFSLSFRVQTRTGERMNSTRKRKNKAFYVQANSKKKVRVVRQLVRAFLFNVEK